MLWVSNSSFHPSDFESHWSIPPLLALVPWHVSDTHMQVVTHTSLLLLSPWKLAPQLVMNVENRAFSEDWQKDLGPSHSLYLSYSNWVEALLIFFPYKALRNHRVKQNKRKQNPTTTITKVPNSFLSATAIMETLKGEGTWTLMTIYPLKFLCLEERFPPILMIKVNSKCIIQALQISICREGF